MAEIGPFSDLDVGHQSDSPLVQMPRTPAQNSRQNSGRVTRHRVLAAMERRAGRLSVHRVRRLISWESFDANLLKPASFSSRSRFIIATWVNSANSSGLWFLPYFRSLHKRFSHSCSWRAFRVDL
eukprot:10452-Heterococcus_DN1.PRE.2